MSAQPSPDYEIASVTLDTVFLVDRANGGVAISDAPEIVTAYVAAAYPRHVIVYRDTAGNWQQIDHSNGFFEGCFPWEGETPSLP